MPTSAPKRTFLGFPCSGVLNEWNDPVQVGGSGLTDVSNLIYHRNGAWGRRPGANISALPNGNSTTPVNGYRWYRAFPSQVTQLVVYAQGALLIGNNQTDLTSIGNFALSGSTPPSFCTARDPQANSGNGADVLIVTGLTLPHGSFGVGDVTITGLPGAQPPSSWITLTAIDASSNTVTTSQYTITGADNPESIANGLCELINATAAFINGANGATYNPFIGETYYTVPNPKQTDPTNPPVPQAIIHMGAQNGGAAGNNIQYGVTWNDASDSGSTLAVYIGIGSGEMSVPQVSGSPPYTPTTTNFVQGGNSFSGPCKVENPVTSPTLVGLSFMCSNPFTFCVSWHQHVWYWGDENNPDTVFASDINQPEAFTFMIENGGLNVTPNNPQTGGYTIGVGDGDPFVQACVPIGNALYVFKTSSIYMIEGYDFQVGEYQFSLTPQIVGYGIPCPYAATVLDEQLVFWSGKKFCRLAVGSYEVEHIGLPLPITEGLCSTTAQKHVRVIAGDMQALTLLNNVYANGQANLTPATVIYRNIAIFSFDLGGGNFLNAVYDDEKSAAIGGYAWTKWYDWNIGCWIQYGLGLGPSGNKTDAPLMCFIDPQGLNFYVAGQNAQSDYGNPIPWMGQTGWIDGGTPEVVKNAQRVYLNASATVGATFTEYIIPGRIVFPGPPPIGSSEYGTQPQTVLFNPTLAPNYCEATNNLNQYIANGQQPPGAPIPPQLPIQAKSFMLKITEPGTAQAGFEIRSLGIDVVEEALAD
ncbi:MAG: hypothetical protein WA742_09235 [Candidatus Cybelea sp.]